jgi:ribosomal protein S18 acetylase RimI-like enzyme
MIGSTITIRPAHVEDLSAVVRLLADDPLGAAREQWADPVHEAYRIAFDAMQRQEGNHLLVAIEGDRVVGCLQLIVIPGLSRLGTTRAEIEGVRVAASHRRRGLGETLVRDAMLRARDAGCTLMQLTSDASRTDARRFYERLGFVASHVGFKRTLEDRQA